jgi:hypothetical protein
VVYPINSTMLLTAMNKSGSYNENVRKFLFACTSNYKNNELAFQYLLCINGQFGLSILIKDVILYYYENDKCK